MDVRCDKCSTEYEFDENRIGANGVTVKCTACGFVFKVRRPSTPGRSLPPRANTHIGKGPQGKEWLVKKPDGQMIAFRELTTLQKWIVEGRISREDEISKNGETWKRLGNILELEPFFSVYEKAQALTGDVPGRLELRGSEVLSAHSPIPTIGPDVGPRSAMSALPLSIPPRASDTPYQTLPPPPPPPAPTIPVPVPPSSNGAHGPGIRATIPQASTGPRQISEGPSSRRSEAALAVDLTPPPSSGLDRSLQLGPAPASFNRDTFDIPDRRRYEREEEEVRSRSTSRVVLFSVLTVLAAAGGGIAAGVYGPDGNPIKELLLRYGLLPPAKDDGAYRLVEEAQKTLDLDALPHQQKALTLLAQAQALRPSDPVIAAERAFMAAHLAATQQRWAEDLEGAAQRAQEVIDRWREAKKEQKAKKDGDAPAPELPKPATPEPKDLLAVAKEKRELMATALKEAEDLLIAANKIEPNSLEAARAAAGIRLVRRDPVGLAEALGRAKTVIDKSGRADAATLYLEAAALAISGPEDGSGADRVIALTDQALTTRPTLIRARILEARARLQKGDLEGSKRALDLVRGVVPDHEEAQRLHDQRELLQKKKDEAEKAAKEAAPPPVAEAPAESEKPEEPVKDFDYWMKTADRLREKDRTTQALNAYGRAADLKPNSAETHTGKGWCFLDLEKPQAALAAFERALSVNDKYADAYYGMAEAHRVLNHKPEAIAAYEQYLARAPSGTAERKAVQRAIEELKK
ncbi:MAG: zinc-ribbon domain-containing protein [Deltaproteobacteria bacterium]|nr:zinc-ribbon domain-containing protein [Deltaproteobacteria bacterium]